MNEDETLDLRGSTVRRSFDRRCGGIFSLRHQCGDRGCQETGICPGRGKEESGEHPEPAGGIKGRYGSLCKEAGRQSVLPGRGAGTAGKPDRPEGRGNRSGADTVRVGQTRGGASV